MGFYEERLLPIIDRTVDELVKTEHMQHILHGTMPLERFQFQLKQNFNYLKDFSRCWAVGLAKCMDYDELSLWYRSFKGVFEEELGESLRYWMQAVGLTFEDMEETTMAQIKRSYTSHELARAFEGDHARQLLSQFPCTILYLHFADRIMPQCTLPADNMYRYWLEFYTLDWYRSHCGRSIKLVNKLTEGKSPEELTQLEEVFAIGCNYEYLQFKEMYQSETTWPIPDILPEKRKTMIDWSNI